MSVTGLPGQGPVRVGIPIADLTAGIFLAQGVLGALIERERSGKGQWVHTSLLEAMVTMLDFQAARWLIDGTIPPQAGNDHPTGIPTGVFKTSDGHINIAASGQHMFRRLCEALGTEPLLEDPRFKMAPDRSKNRQALNAELEKAMARKTSAEWVELLNAKGVPSGPILNIKETFENEQVKHLGLAVPVKHHALGELRLQRPPVTLSRTPAVGAHGRAGRRRAHRRDPGRARLLRRRHQGAAQGQGGLGVMSEHHFSPSEIADLLESAAAAIRAEVEALPKAVTTFHPAEGRVVDQRGDRAPDRGRAPRLRRAHQESSSPRRIRRSRRGTRTRWRAGAATT